MEWILLKNAAKQLEMSEISLNKRIFMLSDDFEKHVKHHNNNTYISCTIMERVKKYMQPDFSVWDEIAVKVGFKHKKSSRNSCSKEKLARELQELKKELRKQDELLRKMGERSSLTTKSKEKVSYRKKMKSKLKNSIRKRLIALFRPALAKLT